MTLEGPEFHDFLPLSEPDTRVRRKDLTCLVSVFPILIINIKNVYIMRV